MARIAGSSERARCARLCSVGAAVLLAGLAYAIGLEAAEAERLTNSIAVFSALDKVTARISKIEVRLGDTATFGSLEVTPRACYSRPPTEPPQTTAFVEVDEVKLDKSEERIFTGWMLAESPGMHGVEHPVYDVWLTACADPPEAATAAAEGDPTAGQPEPEPTAKPKKRRRVKRQ